MNFEQNFNPLEPGSEEYQSLDIAPLSNPLLGETLPELQTVTRKLASREVPLPKKIGGEIKFEPAVTDEVRSTYNVVQSEKDYFDKLITSKRDSFSQDSAEYNAIKGYISEANKFNQPNSKERVELIYNLGKDFLDIEKDDATRNSFIRSHYAPLYFSSSKVLKQEYDASPLNVELSPRQYTGLKSLTYGKQSEYNDIVSTLTSPESTDVDKQIAKYKLDKLGAYIDIDAAAKMVNDSGYEVKTEAGVVRNQDKKAKEMAKTGMDLYNASVQSLPIIDEMVREVEYQNPYNKTVLLNNIDNTFKRGLLIGEEADIINAAVDGSGIDADRLAEIQRLKEEAKSSKALEDFLNTLSFDSFSKNPVGILAELITESFVALYRFGSTRMASGAAVGAPLGPGGTAIGVTAGMGAASLGLEKAGVILEELQNRGYNTKSAEDIKKAFSDEKLMSELVKEGYKKGIPIAIFDMLSMGLAGKLISKPARTVGGRILQGAGEVAVQSGLGGGGEIAGQLVQKGKVTDWSGVVAEAISEIGTGVPEIAFGAITNKAKNNQQIERKDLVTTVSEMGIDKAFENVDVMVGSGSITAQQGENIKQRLKETAEQVAKLPSALSTDAKTTIVDLINERDRILAGSENLDDVFKKEANKAAANINDRIATIAREDISSQEKQKEDATKESLKPKQEIIEQGGVSQYQRAEEVQDQATTEADNRNRPVSGTQEVAFQKAGPVSIQWERSPEGKGDPSISARNPIVMEAAQKLKAGEISNEEYRATVSQNSPITPITRFFEPATENEIKTALNADKVEKVNAPIADNTVVGLRLDIPAYKNKNTWVVSVHEGDTDNGPVMSYSNVGRITDVRFSVKPKGALGIAAGVEKTTIGRMFGKWQNIEGATMEEQGENAKKIVQDVVNNPDWVQVGMNPFRHSYFYDRSSSEMGRPIQSAEEVIQIGGLVYAKNPVYGEWTDEAYRVKGLLDVKGEPVQFQKSEQVLSIVDGFFSPIEKRILEFKQPKASVQKWKDIVGIKSDEAVFSGMSDWLNSKNPSEQLTREEVAQFINDNRIKSEIVKNFEGVRGEAKYQGLILPGGDKYREILFTLPNLSSEFRSTHFDDKNIAVHLRVNDRKDINRNRVLFLEEVQSDWGQKGRDGGFGESELYNEYKDLLNKFKSLSDNELTYPLSPEVERMANRIDELEKITGAPVGPYVTKTNAWVKMGLKIALQEAIATGKNRIAWTTGEQQNERYELEKKGMDAFYGNVKNPGIIANVAKALIKELTGKEGNIIDVQINTNEEEDITKRVFNETDVNTLAKYGFRFFRDGDELTQEAAVESVNSKRPVFARKEFTTSQPGIEITPELRDAVLAGMPQFQKTINNQDNIAAIADEINNLDNTSVDFEMSDLGITAEANVDDLINRKGLALKPQVIEISDFKGIPVMVTISDELTTGAVINPVTGNIVPNLAGGIGFNYSEGNTGYAWAYTDEATARDTFNTAKEIYNRNPQLYPDGIIPVAVVKMGTQAMNSNEAIFRVFIENISTLPADNLENAYKAYQKDVDENIKRLEVIEKSGKLTPSSRNEINGYRYIRDTYLKQNKNISDVIKNINQLNINTRPLVINRITAGEIGLIPADNRLKAGKPAAEALVKGLPKEDIKKIHLGHIGEILRDNAIKNVPDKHIISFVGIDVNAEGPVKIDTHPNYPYALRGRGLGVVKNTAHLASVMPTAYANSIKKVTDATLKGESVTKSQAVSRGLPSGLSNTIFRGKTLAEGMSNMEKLTGFLNLSFPKVTFFNDQQSFEDIISSANVKKYVKNGEIVYGLTTNGNIYLNPSIATMNTAIHEMGHIWTDFIENTNKPLFKKGIELVEGTKELEIAISQLGDNTAARKEALAMLIGNRGENITNAAQKSKFKEWLVGLWKYLQKKFPELRKLNVSQIGNLSLEQFLGGALRDILGGTIISEDPSTYTYQDVKKMSDLVPIGENLPSGPTGPTPPGEVGPVREGAGPVEKKKYDWEMGDRADAAKGEQMIKTSTGRYVALETMRARIMESKKILKEVEKARESWFKKIINETKVYMLDNQYRVLSLLQSVGKAGQLVSSYLRTRNSASATATMMAEKAVKDIYGNISKKKKYQFGDQELTEYQLFNDVIAHRRAISIQNQMDQTYRDMLDAVKRGDISEFNKHEKRLLDNGMIDESGNYLGVDENGKFVEPELETEFSLGNTTATQSINHLYQIRETVGEEDFNKFMKLSDAYSQYFNGMMKDRMEAGLISVDTYEYLSKFFYAPTRYINNILLDPILSLATPTTSNLRDKTLELKDLSGGSERLNMNDYEGLLRATTYASEYSIAENRSTNRFFDLVQENKENFEKNSIKIGVNYIPVKNEQVEQIPIYKKMKQIAEGKKPSMDKALPSSQKMLPYKGVMVAHKLDVGQVRIMEPNVEIEVDEAGNKFKAVQVPLKAGEDYIKVYKDGRRVDLIVPAWFADAWYNRNMPSTKKWSFIGKITGSNLLRIIATGINPVFGVAQLIPDTISAYVSTARERKYMPLLIDYPVFFMKTLAAAKDIKNNSNDFIEANKYGATTNFYNGGMVTFERGLLGKEDKSLEKVIEEWNVPGLKQYIMGSKKITETTEQMSKVALYKEIRDSKIAAFTKENGLAPIGQDLEDIRIEAAAAARATADFHRKGTLGSQLNMVIPYLNAAIQVQRAVIGSTKQNPLKVLGYSMEFAAYGVMIMLSALGFGDDDELKEKKRIAWSKLSDFDKDNRVPLYFVESKGKFVSVKLPQFVSPLWTLIRRSTEQIYKGDGYDYSSPQFSKDARAVVISTMEQFPLTQFLNGEKVASRNPLYSGMSKLFFNRDPYRQEEVVAYEEATIDYLEGAKTGEKRAAKIYQMIGKAAVNPFLIEGLSPKRLEAAANTIPFENNPFSGVLIAATEFATSEKDLFEERFGKDALSVILKASGISQRYFKEGSRINQDIVDMPMEEVKQRGLIREKIASMLVPVLDEKMKTMTAEEAFKAVRDEFISKEYKTLDPESKKIAESYIKNELKALAISSKNKLDPMVNQIVKMTTSDAKIDAMVKTLNEIKISDESKMKFVGDMFESKIFESSDLARRLAERGRPVLTNGEPNPYYENKVGVLRDMILRYRESKSGK